MIQKFYSTLNEFLINGVIYTTFMCNYDSHVQDISFESGSSYQRYWRNEIVKFVIVRSWEDEKGGRANIVSWLYYNQCFQVT